MATDSLSVRELPLFPLPEVVLFPGRLLPLHIFEYRYRILIQTILESDRRFGVLLWDPAKDEAATIGCCAELIRHQRLPDDRMNVWTLGQQRFRVLDYVREKPFRVGLVEWIEDEPTDEDLKPLATEVNTVLQDVVQLSGKLSGQEIELPDDLPDLPRELSYWVAGHLYGVYRRAAKSARNAEHPRSPRSRTRNFGVDPQSLGCPYRPQRYAQQFSKPELVLTAASEPVQVLKQTG